MKHNLKITILLFSMFIITQFIGLYVVNYYSSEKIFDGVLTSVEGPELPFGLESPEIEQQKDYSSFLSRTNFD